MPRLDIWLVESGHYSSRQVAKRAIKEGKVLINGKSGKASSFVTGKEDITILADYEDKPLGFHKLKTIDETLDGGLIPPSCIALDIGSSAGGFLAYLASKQATALGIEVSNRFSDKLTQIIQSNPNLSLIIDDAFTIEPTMLFEESTLDLLLIDVTTDEKGTLELISKYSILLKPDGRLVAAFKVDNNDIVLQLIEFVKQLGFHDIKKIILDSARQEVHIIGCRT